MKTEKSVEFSFTAADVGPGCKEICSAKIDMRTQVYLVMGDFMVKSAPANSMRKGRIPPLIIKKIMPWFSGPMNRDFRQAEKRLQNLKCSGLSNVPISQGNSVRKNGGNKNKNKKI